MANRDQVALLQQGTKAWNAWRAAHPHDSIDCRYAELRSISLSQADLRGADLSAATLNHVDLRGANLSGASLSNANISSTDLSGADMSGVTCFYTDLNGVNLSGTNLSQADLRYANLSATNLRQAKLEQAKLRYANLSQADLSQADLRHGTFTNANFSAANLSQADLSGANFNHADLSRANLSHANLKTTNLQGADLRQANLRTVQALAAQLDDAILTGACIDGWQVDNHTSLKNLQCDYIFQQFIPETGTYDRRLPVDSNRNFAPGEFGLGFQVQESKPATISLSFTAGIDWKAFAQALQDLDSQFPEAAISLQGLERQQDVFIVRLTLKSGTDKATIAMAGQKLYATRLTTLEAQYEESLRSQGFHRQEVRRAIEIEKQEHATLGKILTILADHQGAKYENGQLA